MKTKISVISFFMTFLLMASCSHRVMDFTLVSSKNVELSKFSTYQRGNSRVEGTDSKPIIVFIPTGYPDGKEAIDRAIESVPGAVALVDGVLTYKWFWIPCIYGNYTFVVEGTPLIDPALASIDAINKIDDYSICLLDKKGDIQKAIQLEKEQYDSLRDEIFNSPNRMYRKMKR